MTTESDLDFYVERFDKLKVNFLLNNLTIDKYNDVLDTRKDEIKESKKVRNENYTKLINYLKIIYRCPENKCHYKSKTGHGRRYCPTSIQSVPREFRNFLCENIGTDIDIVNCHFNILLKICNDLGYNALYLTEYCNSRDKCIKTIYNELNENENENETETDFSSMKSVVKKLTLSCLNSQKKLNKLNKSPWLKNFDAELKDIQSKLIECEKYKFIAEHATNIKNNYNGSFISHVLCYEEDIILKCVERFMKDNNVEILGLMYDGLIVYSQFNKVNLLEEYILKKCGFNYKFTCDKFTLENEIECIFSEFNNYTFQDIALEPVVKMRPDQLILKVMLEWTEKNNLIRLKNTEKILIKMPMNWGKIIYKTANEFINDFIGNNPSIENLFLSKFNTSYKKMITEVIISGQPNKMFPCVEKNWRYYAFKNGIYDIREDKFITTELNGDILCNNYFPEIFKDVSEPPDVLTKIFSDQKWTQETIDIYCGLMGRLFYPLNECDKYGIITCNVGVSSTGKSTILERITDIVDNTKTLSTKCNNFSLEGLDKANLIYIGEAEDLPNMLSISDFKKLARGEMLKINGKHKAAVDVIVTAPTAMCSNELIDYNDKSDAIKNRLTFFKHNYIVNVDGKIKSKMEKLNPILLVFFNKMYIAMYEKNNSEIEMSEQLEEWKNSIHQEQNDFLSWLNMRNEDLYIQIKYSPGKFIKAKDLTDAWDKHCKFGLNMKKQIPKIGINEDAYLRTLGIDTEFKNYCNFCEKDHIKTCCEYYNRTKKKNLKRYTNCELVLGQKNRDYNHFDFIDPE